MNTMNTMNTRRTLTWARYASIAGAVLIPALVLAQQQRNPPGDGTFVPNSVLRADQVEGLRDALADAIARINQLEARAVNKSKVYERAVPSAATAQFGVARADSSCDTATDILLDCGCQGLQGTANSLQFDLRRVESLHNGNVASSCVCQAQNVGDTTSRVLVTKATCLTAP